MAENDADRVRLLQLHVVELQRDIFAANKALTLQAADYKEHLERLNYSFERARVDRSEFLTKEAFGTFLREEATWRLQLEARFPTYLTLAVHERFDKDLIEWRRRVDEGIAVAKGSRAAIFAAISIAVAVMSMIVSLAGAIERFSG